MKKWRALRSSKKTRRGGANMRKLALQEEHEMMVVHSQSIGHVYLMNTIILSLINMMLWRTSCGVFLFQHNVC